MMYLSFIIWTVTTLMFYRVQINGQSPAPSPAPTSPSPSPTSPSPASPPPQSPSHSPILAEEVSKKSCYKLILNTYYVCLSASNQLDDRMGSNQKYRATRSRRLGYENKCLQHPKYVILLLCSLLLSKLAFDHFLSLLGYVPECGALHFIITKSKDDNTVSLDTYVYYGA